MIDDETGAGHVPRGVARAARGTVERVGRGALSDHTRNRIGGHLRAMYDSVVQQPVPDRFMELIEKLGQETDQQKRSN